MRARKRLKPMVIGMNEPELRNHAMDTRFRTLIDDIHSDPAGRGRVPAASPLMAYSGVNSAQISAAQEQALGELRAKRTGGNPNDPEAGDLAPIEDLSFPPQGQSPVGLLSGGQPYKRPAPETPAWEQGDTEAIPGLEFPPDATAKTMDPVKPDYGRVEAEKIKPTSAGPAPEPNDPVLAGVEGVGTLLMLAGGKTEMAKRQTDQSMAAWERRERELREHGARQAELDGQAAKDQRIENRYASETNYGRARDEVSDLRENTRDAAQAEDRRFTRGLLEGDRAYERDPARRQEELDAYRGKKKIDAEFARKRGTGTGGGQANRDAAYRAMMDSAKELYPNGVPQNVANEIALRAMDKDPVKAAAGFIGGIRGERRQESQFEGRQAQASARAEEAKSKALATISELDRLIATIDKEQRAGNEWIPGKEPLVTGLPERATRGAAMTGLPQLFGNKRGSNGLTPDQALINSAPQLLAQAAFHATTGQTANMAAEREIANTKFMNAGRLADLRRELEFERARLDGTLKSGKYVPRDDDGKALVFDDPTQSGSVPPLPPGFQLENP